MLMYCQGVPSRTATPTKRSYSSSRRARQAAQTREDVLHAAMERFAETGWAGTTLAAIAEAADVSVETIYNGFGSKKGLLRAAIDTAIVGDTAPVPLVDRPEFAELAEGTTDERIARGAALVARIHERSARLCQALVEAASGDAEVDGWRLEMEQGRHLDVARSAERVAGRPVDEPLVTMLWILYSPDTYLKLVDDRGFTAADYEAFVIDASRRLIAGA
jgi:AcrR family transcriptional regulator